MNKDRLFLLLSIAHPVVTVFIVVIAQNAYAEIQQLEEKNAELRSENALLIDQVWHFNQEKMKEEAE